MHRSYHCTTWKAFITESWTFATLRNSALNHLLTNIESYFEQGLTNGSQLQQTRILFIRSFHFHGKTYWYASVYYYFLSAKKKIYAEMRMEKLCGPFYSTSRKMFLIHPAYLTFDPLRSYSTYCEKPLLADLLQNRLHYMHEHLHLIRPKLAEDTALLSCAFDDPWESYCPWNLMIFSVKI